MPRFQTKLIARAGVLVASVAAMALSGCGSEPVDPNAVATVPVALHVTLDGRPIEDATVIFHPVDQSSTGENRLTPRGLVQPDGSVVVTTYRRGDGLPPGEYQLAFSWQGPLDGLDEDEIDELKERMPRAYTRPATSGQLIAVLADEQNEFAPIEL